MWDEFEQLWYSDANVEEFASNIVNAGKKIFKYNPDAMDRRNMRDLERQADEMRAVGVANIVTGLAMVVASFIAANIVLKIKDGQNKHYRN